MQRLNEDRLLRGIARAKNGFRTPVRVIVVVGFQFLRPGTVLFDRLILAAKVGGS